MQQPSRRQFVCASLAGLPVLAGGTASLTGVPSLMASEQATAKAGPVNDPVLQQILADLRDLAAEGEAQPAARKASMRGIESTVGILAAHVSTHYDSHIRGSVRRREARLGRAILLDELVALAHKQKLHTVSPETMNEAITRITQRGVAGDLRDVQKAMRAVRLNAPDALQRVAFRRAQFDYCSDLNWMIRNMEGIVGVVCAIAFLEPTLGGEAACGALLLAISILQLQRQWFC